MNLKQKCISLETKVSMLRDELAVQRALVRKWKCRCKVKDSILTLNCAGLSPEQCGQYNDALVCASRAGDLETMRLLIRHGADVKYADPTGWTPLHEAASNGNLYACKLLLDCGAKVDKATSSGATALMLAADDGYVQTCDLLINRGACVNTKDKDWRTPLHAAASSGSPDTCKLLLGRGANVNAQDKLGRTPLWFADSTDDHVIAALLQEHGGVK